MSTNSLRIENIGVLIGERWLLRNISLRVDPGEIVAIVGPNGAGKSTLLSVVAGDLEPESGRVLLDDKPVLDYTPKELALRRAVLPQQAVIQFAFTAREIVQMGRSPRGTEDDDLVVNTSMQKVDADYIASRVFPSLSVGEQSRVSLARVLAQEAPLLLLDEPTAALDLKHQLLVTRIARDLADQGATIIVILHDLNLAATSADRLLLLKDGHLMADGPPWETLNEGMVEAVFDCPVTITKHPQADAPLVLPRHPEMADRPTSPAHASLID